MATPSRESFDDSKDYQSVVFLQQRYVPDFSLNELQQMQDAAREDLGDTLYHSSAVVSGMNIELPGSGQIVLGDGQIWAYGRVRNLAGATLAYDPLKVSGSDIVYARWLLDHVTLSEDPTLVHPALGEAIDERARARVTLVTTTPDLFDETFARFAADGIPLTWTRPGGSSAKGYPAKFGRTSCELIHTNGTETRIEREIALTPSTLHYLYVWVRTKDGSTDLSLSHGAYVDFERTAPAWASPDFTFATAKQWARKDFSFTADSSSEVVTVRFVIPSTAPSTSILIDSLLVTTVALGASDLERHYLPLFAWDRATDEVTRVVPRATKIPMKELVPPLPGTDIAGIDQNQGLLDLQARRIWQENGHYKIPPGLQVRRNAALDTSGQLGVEVLPGIGSVLGYECRIPNKVPFLVDKATSFATVTGENDGFAFGNNFYGLNKSEGIDQFPIKQVTQLQITYEQVVSVTKGSDGSVDDTGVQAVSSIQAASAGTAGQVTGTATTFTFTESAKTFTVSVSPYEGGAVGAAQSIAFSNGTYTLAAILQALNHGSGPVYRSGKIAGNVTFEDDGAGHLRVRTKTTSNASTVTIGSGDANTILGFTNGATNTGTGTHYAETTSWVRSGNSVDWEAGQPQPTTGTSYNVIVRNTETLVLNTDYRLGGAFVASATYHYKVTSIVGGIESQAGAAAIITTPIGGINALSWSAVASAQSYGVYRSDDGGTVFGLLKRVDGSLLSYLDDGSATPFTAVNPPGSGGTAPTSTKVVAGNVGVINLRPVGKMPVDGSNLVVDYEYYQPYMAYIIMNARAALAMIAGEPADRPEPPSLPPAVMELAQLEIKANSSTIIVQNVKKYDRVPMADLRTLVDRVGTLEFSDLRQQVLNDLQKRGDGSTHKGRIAEGFADESGSDFAYDDGAGVASAIGLYPSLAFATLPSTYTQPTLTVNTGNTTAVQVNEEYALPIASEEVLVDQSLVSGQMQVNPYLGVRIPQPAVELFPRSTSWAFAMDSAVTPQQQDARRHTLFAALWRKTVNRFLPPWNHDAEVIQQTAQQQVRKGLDSTYLFETEPITITVEGRAWPASEANIAGSFAGIAVDLTAVAPTTQGTPSGGKTTVNADAMGYWKATFVVPTGVSAGPNDFVATGPTTAARATFTSLAFGQIIPEPPLLEAPLHDPLAQQIGPWPTDQTLSAVELIFVSSGAPDLTRPLFVQFRTMENGFPTRIALMTQVVDPNDLTWNTGGGPKTWNSTKVTLDRPVYVPKNTTVAVTVLTASTKPRLGIATRFQNDQNGKRITNNPYPQGVLFASSNGDTWTAIQDSDLWIKVYRNTYASSAVLECNSVSPADVSRLWLAADQFVPEGTSIKWTYVLNGSVTLPIAPFTKVRPPSIPTGIVVRATISRGSNSHVSPRITLPSLALIGQQRATAGTWISPAFTFTQTVTNALATVMAYIPPGASITWYASRDDGAAWTALGNPTSITDIEGSAFKVYAWDTPVAFGGSATPKVVRIRADVTISSHLNYGPAFSLFGLAFS